MGMLTSSTESYLLTPVTKKKKSIHVRQLHWESHYEYINLGQEKTNIFAKINLNCTTTMRHPNLILVLIQTTNRQDLEMNWN
jgi:hypothetical protein